MKIPVLKIKDANGNLIPINAIRGEAGANGKSAYEQAKDGGYKGTEAEFIAILNGLTNTGDAEHYSDFNNPHKVTAEQTGALPIHYPTSTDLNTEITMGGNRSAIHCYNEQTLNTPYKEMETNCTHGMVITNAHSPQYATQMCMPSGSSAIFTRTLNGQGISKWARVANTNDLSNYLFYGEYEQFKQTVIQSFTNTEGRVTNLEESESQKATVEMDFYQGTGKSGNTNPTIIDIKPNTKAAIIYSVKQYSMMSPLMCLRGQFESVWYHPTLKATIINMEWTNTQLKIWHASSPDAQFNEDGTNYGYMLING